MSFRQVFASNTKESGSSVSAVIEACGINAMRNRMSIPDSSSYEVLYQLSKDIVGP